MDVCAPVVLPGYYFHLFHVYVTCLLLLLKYRVSGVSVLSVLILSF